MDVLTIKLILTMLVVVYSFEYKFDNKVAIYEVVEGREAVFVCELDGMINVIEIQNDDTLFNNIVVDSEAIDARFTYSNVTKDNKTIHKISLIKVLRYQHNYRYICLKTFNVYKSLSIKVQYKPDDPICYTNFYDREVDEPLLFRCLSEDADPVVDIESIIPPFTYPVDIGYDITYVRNRTHTMRSVKINPNYTITAIDSFRCITIQDFHPQLNVQDFTKSCSYVKSTTTSSATTLDTDSYTIPTESSVSNSGTSIYGSLICILCAQIKLNI